jgi:hypothetical protein
MDHTFSPGGSLSLAVDRLDKALEALEARVMALREGQPLPDYVPPPAADVHALEGLQADYQRVVHELETIKAREQQLAQAAEGAFYVLGAAAADIRSLVKEDAA